MTISWDDFQKLRQAGFNDFEIEQISEAKDSNGNMQPPIDINSDAWRFAIDSRREWIMDKQQKNWSQDEINAEIMRYYQRSGKRTPFDFLDGYKTGRKVRM